MEELFVVDHENHAVKRIKVIRVTPKLIFIERDSVLGYRAKVDRDARFIHKTRVDAYAALVKSVDDKIERLKAELSEMESIRKSL